MAAFQAETLPTDRHTYKGVDGNVAIQFLASIGL